MKEVCGARSEKYKKTISRILILINLLLANPSMQDNLQASIPKGNAPPHEQLPSPDPYLLEQESLQPYFEEYLSLIQGLENAIPESNKKEVVLVIMDSGIDASHEDWCSNQFDTDLSKTFLDSRESSNLSPFIDPDEYAYSYHGTQVASVAAACTNNGIGIASLGMDIQIASLRVMFPFGGGVLGNLSDLHKAMMYLKEEAELNPERIIVANMSFTFFFENATTKNLLNAMPPNIHFVAGSGNNPYFQPLNEITYPSGYPEVLSVTAASPDNRLCNFSKYTENSIGAEGCFDLWSFRRDNFPYQDGLSGTSLASANFAGFLAKLLEFGFTIEEIENAIEATSIDLNTDTDNNPIPFNVPKIHPLNVLKKLMEDMGILPTPTPVPTPTPTLGTIYLPNVSN
jgi:hypothetical protein